MKLLSTDKEKCTKCRACAEVCPLGVIGITKEGYPEPKSCAYRRCINCGYCMDICVFDALHHQVRKNRASDPSAAMKRYRVAQERRKAELNNTKNE